MSIGWGIIGIGAIADIAVAPAIVKSEGSSLVGVCGRDLDRATGFAAKHGALQAFTEFDSMLAEPNVAAVYIATPNALHHEHALAALRAGKHVLVEKPITLSAPDAEQLIQTAEEQDRLLAVGFHLRHKAANIAAREVVLSGRLGRLGYVHLSMGGGKDHVPFGTWRADAALVGGGSLINQGTHALDMLSFLTGETVAEVSCMTDSEPLDDVVVACCRLVGGGLATVSSYQLQPGVARDWLIVGDQAWLEGRGTMHARRGDSVVLHEGGEQTVIAASDQSAYRAEIASFNSAISDGTPVNGDGADGLRNVQVVEALARAKREGRVVRVP